MILGLDFDILRKINQKRAQEFFGDAEPWSTLERCGEMTGEAGEAANVAKKMKRGWKMENGIKVPHSEKDRQKFLRDLADELADVIITADLTAAQEGIDLGAAVIRKFNEKSENWGCEQKL